MWTTFSIYFRFFFVGFPARPATCSIRGKLRPVPASVFGPGPSQGWESRGRFSLSRNATAGSGFVIGSISKPRHVAGTWKEVIQKSVMNQSLHTFRKSSFDRHVVLALLQIVILFSRKHSQCREKINEVRILNRLATSKCLDLKGFLKNGKKGWLILLLLDYLLSSFSCRLTVHHIIFTHYHTSPFCATIFTFSEKENLIFLYNNPCRLFYGITCIVLNDKYTRFLCVSDMST